MIRHRIRRHRNPRSYTDDQKAQLAEAEKVAVRARIYELGVSEFLKDDCGMNGDAVSIAADIIKAAAFHRKASEDIYERVRREADQAAEESEESLVTQ